MSRSIRLLALLATLAAAAAAAFALPALSGADAESDQADGLEAGVAGVAGWLGGLQGEGEFGKALPGLRTSTGSALNLGDAMGTLKTAVEGLDATGAGDLATKLEGLSGEMGGAQVDLQTANVDTTGPVVGFDLTVTAERTVEKAKLALEAPAANGVPEVSLGDEGDTEGVPLDSRLTALFNVRWDADRNAFHVESSDGGTPTDASDDTPKVSAAATVADFAFPSGFRTAIGFGDVDVADGSTFDLDASILADVLDPNGDGRVAFQEPGNPEGDNQLIPAELSLPVSQIVTDARSGTADVELNLDSPFTAADDDATLLLAGPDLGQAPATTVTGGDVDELANFDNVEAVEVLSGLAQYATAIRAMQSNPNVDAELPFMSGRLSDVLHVEKAVADFVDAHTQEVSPGQDIDDVVDFRTVAQLADEMQGGDAPLTGLQDSNDGAAGKLSPVYDPATDKLTFDLRIASAPIGDAAEEDMPQPPAPDTGQATPVNQANEIGLPQIGGELAALTGISSVGPATTDPHSQAKRKTAFTIRLPFVIDLSDATPREDDPETQGIEEFESPMPNERYRVGLGGTNEIETTQEVRTPVTGKGVIGFVGFDVADSNLALTRAATDQPMLRIDADPAKVEDLPAVSADAGAGDRAISTLLKKLSNDSPETSDDPIAPAQPNWRLDGVLREDARGPGTGDDDYRLTAERGKIDIHWANPNQPIGAGDVTLDATAEMLKALNLVPPTAEDEDGEPAALLGRTLDSADGLLEGIDGVFTDKPLLDTDIPFLGASARDLFASAQTLQDKIDEVRQHPPATLQELETALQDLVGTELGLSDSARRGLLRFSLKNLGGGAPELITRLGFEQETQESRPINLAVPGLPASIAGAAEGGALDIVGTTDFDLAFPITLDGSAPQARILDSSGFSVSAETSDTTGEDEIVAAAGPLGVRLGDAAANSGRYGAGVKFSAYPGPDGAKIPEASEQPVSLSSFLGDITPKLGSSQDGGFDCTVPDPNAEDEPPAPPATVHGDLVCIAMPVFLKTGNVFTPANGGDGRAADNYLTLSVDDDLTPHTQLPTGFDASKIAAQLLNFDSFKDGFAKLQAILELALQGATYGEQLPLVGDQIAAGAKVIDPVRKIAEDLQSITAEANAPVGDVNALIRQKMFDALDALPADFLRDTGYGPAGVFPGDADTVPSPTDIRVLMLCGGDNHVCGASEKMSDLSDVSLDMELGSGSAGDCVENGGSACADTKTLPLDFGIPGLNLSGPASSVEPLNASAGWSLGLGFGVSKAGFYLKDNPLPSSGEADADDSRPELDVGFRVGLADQGADTPELEGKIGFLDIEMEDGTSQSNLNAGFKTNLVNGSGEALCDKVLATHCGHKVDIAQLPGLNVADLLVPTFGGGLNVDLKLATGVDTGSATDDIGQKLPKITTDFLFTWEFTQDSIGDLEPPTIAFNDVAIDPGTLFAETLNPIFDGLKRFTKPVEPIREFIFAPIPIISELSRLFGGSDVSFVDLAEIFGDVDLALLKDINGLLDFVDNLPSAAGEGIVIGDFAVSGEQATGSPTTPDQAQAVAQEVGEVTGDVLAQAKGAITDAGKANKMQSLIDGGSGSDNADSTSDIEVPILEDPDCVFGMLIGGDCDLFRYRPDPFRVRFDYEQAFGPFFGVLYVTVGGYAGAGGRLDIGYDTKGLRMLIQDIQAGTATPGDAAEGMLEGVFLGDLDQSGQDVNELEVQAGITAGAKLSVVLAELGARGGIDATVGLNLHDGPDIDGKLRISEIKRKLAVPWCLFDVTGRLSAFLEAYAKLGVGPFSVEKTFELARIVLLDFSEGCPETEPVLASKTGDVLRLNIGTDDGARNGDGPGWTNAELDNDGNESYVVRQVDADTVSVTAFGFTKQYGGVASILVNDAGNGADSILFQGLKQGGHGKQETGSTPNATADFTLPVKIDSLGSGEDTTTTGVAGDEVHGGPDGDTINLGAGADDGYGDGGLDTISGAGGKDDLFGGEDADNLDGGLGEDTVKGEGGDDRIDGGRDLVGPGSGLSAAEGTDVGDTLIGGADSDEIDGGSGEDFIHGDEEMSDDSDGDPSGAADVLAGGVDKDVVFGGEGDDTVFGGLSDETNPDLPVDTAGDELHGNGGADTLRGGKGGDKIWGGSGDDKGFGDEHVDVIRGQADEDVLRGASGGDEIHGGGEDDEVFGESDGDDLFGDAGADLVMGAGGDDDIDGGSGNDRQDDGGGLFGDDGDDDIRGNADSDDLFGGSGMDVQVGDEGTIADDRTVTLQEDTGAADRLFGDNEDDRLYGEGGNDELRGGPHADLQFGNGGKDLVLGQTGTDRLVGGSARSDAPDVGDDVMGGTEDDVLLGDNGTIATDGTFVLAPTGIAGAFGGDTMNGGPGDDVMHGQDGTDLMYGAENRDRMFGDLAGDTMYGQSGQDHMLGDQGSVQLTGGLNPGESQKATVLLQDPAAGGEDVMDGGSEDDGMYGGAATDTMSGGFADDHMEGNDGQDRMFGASQTASDGLVQGTDAADALLDGQDDMIGGSSTVNPLLVKADEGEIEMRGDGAQDVMTGDNAVITRTADAAGTAWLIDNITGGAARDVQLLDTEKRGAALLPVGGADTMLGNDGNDRMYGESDTDTVKGNAQEDYLEGNQDRDWVEGNTGQDDLVGGSAVGAQPDDGDYLHGGADADVVTGDNAIVTRDETKPGGPYSYVIDRLEIPTKRYIKLLDVTNAQFAAAAGPDQESGGAGVDVLFGQDEGDFISGGSEDDYMEGNGDIDREWGDDLLSEVGGIPPVIGALSGAASAEPELSGAQGADGQDEQVGGSSLKAHRDDKDYQYGNGASDVQIGDNGEILRRFNEARTAYLFYEDANATTLQRQVNRYDVGGGLNFHGPDEQYGDAGDDYQYGQDDGDVQYGGDDNDVQYGELGKDRMFGEAGQDAMVGDRGMVTDDLLRTDDADDQQQINITTQGPGFFDYTSFRPGTLHRYVDLKADGDGDMDGDGNPVEKPGLTVGDGDYMRGGPDKDSMHGAFGDDVMNGDAFGDYLYGDDGADAMWGGKGSTDPGALSARGLDDSLVDIMFGGHGGNPNKNQGLVTGGADVLDYRPRAGTDPAEWLEATNMDDADPANDSHHQGIDWIYGGYDRDVLQADVGQNQPDGGDRLMDWNGAYNLFTHCHASYGGDNDIRQHSPDAENLIKALAYGTGAGDTRSALDTAGTSAFRELGYVYPGKDANANSGKAYPTTPGHFESTACQP